MKKHLLCIKAAIAACVVMFSTMAPADFWSFITPYAGPNKDIVTLVITANYNSPRLLADLVQAKTRQPYLLLPHKNSEGIYLCPVNTKRGTMKIADEDFADFIRFINPKQIIILGDERYVPTRYRLAIDKEIPVITLVGDWNNAAFALGKLLRQTTLAADFKRLSGDIRNSYIPEESTPENSAAAVEIGTTPATPGSDLPVIDETVSVTEPVDSGDIDKKVVVKENITEEEVIAEPQTEE